jgi:hypothetical protein
MEHHMANLETFSFGEGDESVGKKSDVFKPEANRTYRMTFAWYPQKDGKPDFTRPPTFVGNETNFINGCGYVINKGPEYTKIAGEAARKRLGTVIILWPLDKEGNVDRAQLASGYEVRPYVISPDKYRQLKNIHKEWPFHLHDMKATCTDTKFQKMTFNPCKESLFGVILGSEKNKAFADKLIAEVAAEAEKISTHIGREMTIQQIREKLAGGTGGGAGPARDEADAVSTANVDSLVDGLLG